MTYDPNFPQPSTLISQAPTGFQANWQAINSNTSGFSVDHVSLTDTTNGGRHQAVHLKKQTVDPTTLSDEGAIYSKDIGSPDVELFYRRENNGLITQLTGLASSLATNGYYRFPGGLLFKWGKFSAAGGNQIFSWPSGPDIPVFSAIFQVFLQPTDAAGSPDWFVYVNNFNTTQLSVDSTFRTKNAAHAGNFSYLAIGM